MLLIAGTGAVIIIFVTVLTYLPYLGVGAEAHNQNRTIYLHIGGGSLRIKRILEVPPSQYG